MPVCGIDHAAQLLQRLDRHEDEARVVLAHLAFVEVDDREASSLAALGGVPAVGNVSFTSSPGSTQKAVVAVVAADSWPARCPARCRCAARRPRRRIAAVRCWLLAFATALERIAAGAGRDAAIGGRLDSGCSRAGRTVPQRRCRCLGWRADFRRIRSRRPSLRLRRDPRGLLPCGWTGSQVHVA